MVGGPSPRTSNPKRPGSDVPAAIGPCFGDWVHPRAGTQRGHGSQRREPGSRSFRQRGSKGAKISSLSRHHNATDYDADRLFRACFSELTGDST